MEFRGGLAGGGRFGGIGRARRTERRVRRAGLRLEMERLEDRVVLSTPTSTWTGADAVATGNNNWTDAKNWDTLPVSGNNLLFPAGLTGAALNSNDDMSLASGSSFGSLTIQGSGYTIASTQNNTLPLSGSIDASATSGSSSLNLAVPFGTTAATVTVDNAAATLTMGKAITGSAGLTKAGAGVLDLTGTNTYGDTTVAAGTLLVDGSVNGTVTANTGTTLGGVGTVGSITTTAATVSPGDSSTVTGILTNNGSLTLDSSSKFDVTINGTTAGTGYDQLVAGGSGGAISLANATLNVSTESFNPTTGDTFTILHNTSGSAIPDTFKGLADGATVTADGHEFMINYNVGADKDVVLTAISFPSVIWTGTDALNTTNPNANWSDHNNWQGGVAPVAGDTIFFPGGLSGAALTNNNDIASTTFNSIAVEAQGYTISGDGVTLSGSLYASQTSGSSTLNLPVGFGATAATVTVDNTAASLTMGGAVAGSAGLTKQGAGMLDLAGTNTYTGGTTVAAGTLLVDGTIAGAVGVSSGATLGGLGTIGTSTSVGSISATAATVSPGDSATNTGVLTDTGTLTMDSSSNFDVTINGTTSGTTYDQLIAEGAVNLGSATLNVSVGGGFVPVTGDQFTIIHNTSGSAITTTFKNLAEQAGFTADGYNFTISYKGGGSNGTGQDVVLTVGTPTQFTWAGTDAAAGTSTKWSDGNNWKGGVAPSAGDAIIFPTGVSGNALNSDNDISNTIFDSIAIKEAGYQITGDPVGLAGANAIDASQSSGLSTIGLPITLNQGVNTVTVETSGATLKLSGVVAAPSGVTKQGQGTLDLAADNGSLPVAVNLGTLLVDGKAGDVTANTGTTLGGGTVSGTTVNVTSINATAAVVSPGDSSTVTGILNDSGPLVMNSTSSFDATLNGNTAGTGYDQVAAGGPSTGDTITLGNATLNISLGSEFPTNSGQQYTIVKNNSGQAINGTFAGLAEGATLTISNRSFSITYKGGGSSGTGQDVVLTSLLSTTTKVSSPTSRPVSGQSVTLTATVAPATGSGTPTGTVTFTSSLNGTTTTLGTVTLTPSSGGIATLVTTKLTADIGQQQNLVTATYSGDTTYAPSSNTTPLAVPVTQASTTTTVTASPNPALTGQAVTLTATVLVQSPGTGTPTGTVDFKDTVNGTTTDLGSPSLSDGAATLTTTSLPAGTNSITAIYSSDTNFAASTSSPISVVVAQGTTAVSISASNANPFALQPVTFTAIVSSTSGQGTPTGTVTFMSSLNGTTTTLGTGTLSSGAATFTANALTVGPQSILAVYSGDTSFLASTSQPLSVVVGHRSDLFVNQVYLDVLGTPANVGSTLWIALINGGFSPQRVARYILVSKTAKIAAVDHVYESLLDRPATSRELKRRWPRAPPRRPRFISTCSARRSITRPPATARRTASSRRWRRTGSACRSRPRSRRDSPGNSAGASPAPRSPARSSPALTA